jgi:betaine-aldehyde dehydrogenase
MKEIKSQAYLQWIDGKWEESSSGERYNRLSPAHDVEVGTYPLSNGVDVDRAVSAAHHAFHKTDWQYLPAQDRANLINKVADLIRREADRLAYIEVLESGKPISQARGEMQGAANIWEYAAALVRTNHGESYNTLGKDVLGLTIKEPIGVVSIITPWNFPLLIVSQKLPFALAAGCTAVVKPSELTPGTTLILGGLLEEAGLPPGVVNIVCGFGDPVGSRLCEHPHVDMISFTGSTKVGKMVMKAGADTLKKITLELGGKNPQIVFPDADLDAAIDAACFGVFFNAGECCNSGSKILVHEDIYLDFSAKLVALSKQVIVGEPLDESTNVGAIISDTHLAKVEGYLSSASSQNVQCLLGGSKVDTLSGRYVHPTIYSNVSPQSDIAKEEIFGPVLSIICFKTIEEAVDIANDSPYGLSAGVWTKDIDVALSLSRAIKAGTVWINSFMDGWPELPFGGYKQSGLGRELGKQSIDEYQEIKTVPIHIGGRTSWWVSKDTKTDNRKD